MITIEVSKHIPGNYKAGTTICLRIKEVQLRCRGRWCLVCDDVTPLPGAEIYYGCGNCGIGELARPDGSLPDGWTDRKFEQGHMFICDSEICRQAQVCRVCGCTENNACMINGMPCHWVEPDLCSDCADRANKEKEEERVRYE